MEKQTAGRDALSDFAPEFARLNDGVLFGRAEPVDDEHYDHLLICDALNVNSSILKGCKRKIIAFFRLVDSACSPHYNQRAGSCNTMS